MIALYPPPAAARSLAIEGGQDPADLHVTIAYTGPAASIDPDALATAARTAASAVGPITATISGHARFTGSPDGDAIVALVDSPALDKLRAAVLDALAGQGIGQASEHGFTAHCTLAYIAPGDPDPVGRLAPRNVTFTALTAKHGNTATAYPFADIADAAAEAYCAGWALSGGPWTPRIEAGARAAIDTACEHPADPAVLEATLRIGKLDGTWARFFARREHVLETGAASVRAAWDQVAKQIDVAPVVRQLRAESGQPIESDQAIIAGHAAASLMSGAYAHDRHGILLQAVEDALRAGMAEGEAGTLALNAEKHGHAVTETGQAYHWDAAYQSIWNRLAHLPDLPLMAQRWVQVMLNGAARSIGVLLARLMAEGASRAEMAAELEAALVATGSTTATYRAVTLFMDQAIAQAMSTAALNLYASEGITDVYFVTAGDERVCPECDQAEADSPYAPADAPVPGLHPKCRCVLTSDDPAPFKALAAQLA